MKKEYVEKNPQKVLGGCLQYYFRPQGKSERGLLHKPFIGKKVWITSSKKVGEENTEIIIAAKNTDHEHLKYEISDYIYHLMVLMAEKDITWEEITQELSQRK